VRNIFDKKTGKCFDKKTGKCFDKKTGKCFDKKTGKCFDKKTGKWYLIERGWRNNLKLTHIRYTKIHRYPTSNDLLFED